MATSETASDTTTSPSKTVARAASDVFDPLTAHWLAIVSPWYAGRWLTRASRGRFLIAFVHAVAVVVLTPAVITLFDAVRWRYIERVNSFRPALEPSVWLAFQDVWRNWHSGQHRWWGRIEQILTSATLGALGAVLFVAWLQLCRVHRTGSVRASYWRAVRVVSVALIPAAITIAGVYTFVLVTSNRNAVLGLEPGFIAVTLGTLGACWCLVWIGLAIDGIQDERVNIALSPRCQECGYDLTHEPAGGRCTECGTPVRMSLVPASRLGSLWMNTPSPGTWIASSTEALVRPHVFYRELQLRTPGSTERGFARWHCAMFILPAWCWGMFLVAVMNARYSGVFEIGEAAIYVTLPALLFAVGAWGLHRGVGAIVTSIWLHRGYVPDGRWIAKVIAYESVPLWVLSAYFAVFSLSFALFEDWISKSFGPRTPLLPFSMPPEVAVVLAGPLLYALAAIFRYRSALQGIRWSNF